MSDQGPAFAPALLIMVLATVFFYGLLAWLVL